VVLTRISLASFELMVWLSWCVEEDTSFSPFNTYFFSCKWRLSLLATLLSLFLVMFFLSTKFFSCFLTSFLYFFQIVFYFLSKQSWMVYFLQTHFHSLYCKFSFSIFFNFFVPSFSTFTNVLFFSKLHMYYKLSFSNIFFLFLPSFSFSYTSFKKNSLLKVLSFLQFFFSFSNRECNPSLLQ
jgi:hypothetical protein